MYCPNCAQQQVSAAVQYCSRCGMPLPKIKELGFNDSEASSKPATPKQSLTPRQKGMRQGALLMALSVILIPAYILLAALFPANDRLIESAVSDTPFEKISQALLITIFLLGLVRFLYARLYQSGSTATAAAVDQLETSPDNLLPGAQGTPVSGFGAWRETGEIVKPEKRNG